MREKGFATIFGLCLILAVAFVVKGIQAAEANHAREVLSFELEQALQSAAESGLVEAAELVRGSWNLLPYSRGRSSDKKNILNKTKTFKQGSRTIRITVEVWGERGAIYLDNSSTGRDGVYFMSRASTASTFWSETIYRRAYAYVLSEKQDDGTYKDYTTLHFMKLP